MKPTPPEQSYAFTRTSRLEIGYLEWNPQGRRTAVLLHGWPVCVLLIVPIPLIVVAGLVAVVIWAATARARAPERDW